MILTTQVNSYTGTPNGVPDKFLLQSFAISSQCVREDMSEGYTFILLREGMPV